MDYGNYNGGGYLPCGYSAHERWLMGWLTFEEPYCCDDSLRYAGTQ